MQQFWGMRKLYTNRHLILVLRISVALVFIGRAYQHLFWDAPFRSLLWDQALLEGSIHSLFNVNWNDYATSPQVNYGIQLLIRGFGLFYLSLGLLAIFIKEKHKKLASLFLLGSLSLAFLAFLYCKEKFFHTGQFFEYSIQIAAPVLLYGALQNRMRKQTLLIIGMVATGLTFVCHGLYAIGYYPRPGKFVDMTINILHVKEVVAHQFLWMAGLLDFAAVGGMLIKVTRKWSVMYMAFWGLVTAIARLWSGLDWNFLGATLHQNIADMLYRIPHGLIPLALVMLVSMQWDVFTASSVRAKFVKRCLAFFIPE